VWWFDRSSWQQNPAEWNPELRLVAQVGFDREGILWVLTDNRSLEVERQLFYLMPDGRKFKNAGNHLLVQGFTWDADCTVLTSHEKRPSEPESGVDLECSLPAYPIQKKNSEQILDRAKGIWFLPADPMVLASRDPFPAACSAREILRNAFQHAHASRIEAEVAYDSQFLRVRIRDNGKGIDRKVLEEGACQGHWGFAGRPRARETNRGSGETVERTRRGHGSGTDRPGPNRLPHSASPAAIAAVS